MQLFHKRYHPPGTAPGTLASRPNEGDHPVQIQLLDYSSEGLLESDEMSIDEILPRLETDSVTWIRIHGLPDAAWMDRHGTLLGLHPLAQEDVLNGGQRPKLEPYDGQLFIVMNVPDESEGSVSMNQLYLFWHPRYLVSFYTGARDPFEPLLKRLRTAGTRMRHHGLDYLVYSIFDLAVDQAFPVLEMLGLRLETLEEQMVQNPDQAMLQSLHQVKRQIILIRRGIWPQREVVNQLLRDEEDWISEPNRVYLRDCYDHTVQIMDLVESYRDMSAGLLDIYLSSASMRMNEVMRVLTVIATIFIPLTFVAGIYGMNFGGNSNSPWAMPELQWYYGYPLVLALFAGIIITMLAWFRRKHWL